MNPQEQQYLDMTNRCIRLLRRAAYDDSLPGVEAEGITGQLFAASLLVSLCLLQAGVDCEGKEELAPAVAYLMQHVADIDEQLKASDGVDNVKQLRA
jgi:hypothetical protein